MGAGRPSTRELRVAVCPSRMRSAYALPVCVTRMWLLYEAAVCGSRMRSAYALPVCLSRMRYPYAVFICGICMSLQAYATVTIAQP